MIQWLRLSVFALFVPMYVYNRDLLSLLSYYHNKIYLSLIFIRINRVCKEPNRNSNLQICLSFQNHKSLCVPQNSDICQIQNSFSKFQNSWVAQTTTSLIWSMYISIQRTKIFQIHLTKDECLNIRYYILHN